MVKRIKKKLWTKIGGKFKFPKKRDLFGKVESMDKASAACPNVLLQREPKHPGQSWVAKNPSQIWAASDWKFENMWKNTFCIHCQTDESSKTFQNLESQGRLIFALPSLFVSLQIFADRCTTKQCNHRPLKLSFTTPFSPPFPELPLGVTFYWGKPAKNSKRFSRIQAKQANPGQRNVCRA